MLLTTVVFSMPYLRNPIHRWSVYWLLGYKGSPPSITRDEFCMVMANHLVQGSRGVTASIFLFSNLWLQAIFWTVAIELGSQDLDIWWYMSHGPHNDVPKSKSPAPQSTAKCFFSWISPVAPVPGTWSVCCRDSHCFLPVFLRKQLRSFLARAKTSVASSIDMFEGGSSNQVGGSGCRFDTLNYGDPSSTLKKMEDLIPLITNP